MSKTSLDGIRFLNSWKEPLSLREKEGPGHGVFFDVIEANAKYIEERVRTIVSLSQVIDSFYSGGWKLTHFQGRDLSIPPVKEFLPFDRVGVAYPNYHNLRFNTKHGIFYLKQNNLANTPGYDLYHEDGRINRRGISPFEAFGHIVGHRWEILKRGRTTCQDCQKKCVEPDGLGRVISLYGYELERY